MTDWTTWKVVDLRAEAKNRGLPTKGVKAELIQRLIEADAATTQTDESLTEDKAAVDEADPPAENGPDEEVADVNATAKEPSPVIEPNATAQIESGADDKPTSPEPTLEPKVEDTNAAQPGQNNKPDLPTSGPSSDTVVDLQKRKRRSSTPPPSVKRVRQEAERRADEREDVVDFEIGDFSASPKKSPQNGVSGVGKKQGIKEKVKSRDEEDPMEDAIPSSAVVGKAAPDALEVSGEEVYAKRVALAESSKAPSSFSQPHEKLLVTGGQDDYAQPIATAEYSKPSLPLQAQAPTLDVSGEDAFMKTVATGKLSKAPQLEPTPQDLHDDRQQDEQEDLHGEGDAPSLPSVHPPTSALYIRDLMRPLRSEVVEQYILDLIAPSGSEHNPSLIQDFYLDQIRTHAFVVLHSVSAAKCVRAALHNQIWPNESNRKSLFVDFIPPSQVKDWIDREESAPRGNSRRWEVVYEEDGETVVAIHREIGSDRKPSFSRPPPTGPAAAVPVYPGIEAAPRGPRGRGGRPPFENPGTLQTQAHPRLSYTPLDEDVARRRIDNMQSFYSRDPPSDLGKDYHRFTFENVDAFVDRGREVFIGIRPPHRQKEHEERLRRDRLGAAGASSVAESRRDDYRPPPRPSVTDEDRFSRHNDSRRPDWPPRNRGYRGDRGSGRFRGEDPYRYRPGY